MFVTACDFGNNEEPPSYEGELGDVILKPTTTVIEIIALKNSFYQPIVKSRFKTNAIPDRVVFSYQNVDTELEIDSIAYSNGSYVFVVEQEVVYGKLRKGTFDYTITAYYETKSEVCQQGKITIDEDYFTVNTPDGSFFDKDSNWLGPY